MASPLLEFANARVRVLIPGDIQRTGDGRFEVENTGYSLVVCYMKRTQYTGVTSGSRKVPLASELNGEMLPGASGDEFYYRGYALQMAELPEFYDWKKADISDLDLIDIVDQQEFLRPQTEVEFLFGDQTMKGTIQRSTGLFGGAGIDQIIYPAIGVELQLTGSEVLN